MRRISALAALMALVPAVVALGQAKPRSRLADVKDVEREVRRASDNEVAALIASDVEALSQIWSDDFVVTNPLNQLVSKRQVLALVESDTLAFRSYERRIEYFHAYGGLVVIAGREVVVWAGKMPLAGKPSSLRFTAVWRETGGQWQEVARHANLIAN